MVDANANLTPSWLDKDGLDLGGIPPAPLKDDFWLGSNCGTIIRGGNSSSGGFVEFALALCQNEVMYITYPHLQPMDAIQHFVILVTGIAEAVLGIKSENTHHFGIAWRLAPPPLRAARPIR